VLVAQLFLDVQALQQVVEVPLVVGHLRALEAFHLQQQLRPQIQQIMRAQPQVAYQFQ
jgi:hypothetical protein